jgi:hypothetical protein
MDVSPSNIGMIAAYYNISCDYLRTLGTISLPDDFSF